MKSFWKSRVLWFNALVAILTYIHAHFNVLPGFVSAETETAIVLVVNFLLRWLTKTGISVTGV